ncbi:SIMPL domain-containing protein [Streptomyces sp. B21-105]|uniref:SIMPL domain-containing protein n=1 Tax=Streptomyces sp. B21-105 TaxID=3039417 RepID=UPI002FF3C6D0
MPLSRTSVAAALVALLTLGVPAFTAPAAAALPAHPAADAAAADAAAVGVTAFGVTAVRAVAVEAATVTVTGEGSASAEPDLAVVGTGVEATAKTSQAAMDAQTGAAAALLAAVRAQGVADRDIRTENVSLHPVYDYTGGASRLTGYQAAQSFAVTVRQVSKTGAVLQAITDAAGDAARIGSVVFDVSDAAPLQARAREAAHADARAKAEQYARLSGRALGRLISLSEDASSTPRPRPRPGTRPAPAWPPCPRRPARSRRRRR